MLMYQVFINKNNEMEEVIVVSLNIFTALQYIKSIYNEDFDVYSITLLHDNFYIDNSNEEED